MKKITKNMLVTCTVAAAMCGAATHAAAQGKKDKKEKGAVKESATAEEGFKTLPSGLAYKIVKHGTGTRHPQISDHIEMFIHVHVPVPGGDSSVFDSRKMYSSTKPVSFPISAPKFKGDPIEGFMMMVAGDSAVFTLPVDSMKKAGNQPLLPWMTTDMHVEYNVALVSVKTDAEEKKDAAEQSAKQAAIDEKLLQEYFTKNHIKPLKTASGLYYTITEEGEGEKIKMGEMASVYYTGKFLDGKTFDSNVDSAFHHTDPFTVPVGRGRVIKGWDEGLQLLKKGAKAKFYIPSALAYGAAERSQIPANSILVFDIEVAKPVDHAAADEKTLQEYFTRNNIKPMKSPAGVYYTIKQKGLGATAKAGKQVTMNYTGHTMDGKVFDSNTDPKFNHVQPFPFVLGEGRVIKGWDDAIALFQLGTKATLYIPSGLAYGESGNAGIPPNSILVFDVEVLGIDNAK